MQTKSVPRAHTYVYMQDCRLVTPLTPTTDYQWVSKKSTRTSGRTNAHTKCRTNVSRKSQKSHGRSQKFHGLSEKFRGLS